MPPEGSFRTRAGASTISPRRFRAYSPGLPLCQLGNGATRCTDRGSHVRPQRQKHCATALPRYRLAYASRPTGRFHRPEIPKQLGYYGIGSACMARPARSWLSVSHPAASSREAVTRLSYPAISTGCPVEYQVLQVSPPTPDASRRPQQPTCQAGVRPLRAAPQRDFHPFVTARVGTVTRAPVSVSPNPRRSSWRIGSKAGISPASARRSRTSSTTSMRLQRLPFPAWQAGNPDDWRSSVDFTNAGKSTIYR